MTIQINTDHSIPENENQLSILKKMIANSLERYSEHITRIEVHLSDENGNKEGKNDKRCLLEARLEWRQPIAVTSHANTIEESLNDAIEKITASFNTILGKIKSHH
jgi:ribosome-associated translation inhibitor RaiA